MMLGRPEEALAHLDRSLELLPDSPLLLTWSAWMGFALDDWERAASHFERALERLGDSPDVVRRVGQGLRDPNRRPRFLRDLADGSVGPFEHMLGSGGLASTQARFHAMLKVDGAEAALRFLESAIDGPGRIDIYAPLLPAMLGPELMETPEARRVMRLLAETPEG
jgi:tetratricopeptide (TPR) repeat protein